MQEPARQPVESNAFETLIAWCVVWTLVGGFTVCEVVSCVAEHVASSSEVADPKPESSKSAPRTPRNLSGRAWQGNTGSGSFLSYSARQKQKENNINALILCALAVAAYPPSPKASPDDAFRVCVRLTSEASKQGLDDNLSTVVALATFETRFRDDLVSRSGAIGPIQAKPVFWCPRKVAEGCDSYAAGVRAIAFFLTNRPTRREAIGAFTGETVTGNDGHAVAIHGASIWYDEQLACMCSKGLPPVKVSTLHKGTPNK